PRRQQAKIRRTIVRVAKGYLPLWKQQNDYRGGATPRPRPPAVAGGQRAVVLPLGPQGGAQHPGQLQPQPDQDQGDGPLQNPEVKTKAQVLQVQAMLDEQRNNKIYQDFIRKSWQRVWRMKMNHMQTHLPGISPSASSKGPPPSPQARPPSAQELLDESDRRYWEPPGPFLPETHVRIISKLNELEASVGVEEVVSRNRLLVLLDSMFPLISIPTKRSVVASTQSLAVAASLLLGERVTRLGLFLGEQLSNGRNKALTNRNPVGDASEADEVFASAIEGTPAALLRGLVVFNEPARQERNAIAEFFFGGAGGKRNAAGGANQADQDAMTLGAGAPPIVGEVTHSPTAAAGLRARGTASAENADTPTSSASGSPSSCASTGTPFPKTRTNNTLRTESQRPALDLDRDGLKSNEEMKSIAEWCKVEFPRVYPRQIEHVLAEYNYHLPDCYAILAERHTAREKTIKERRLAREQEAKAGFFGWIFGGGGGNQQVRNTAGPSSTGRGIQTPVGQQQTQGQCGPSGGASSSSSSSATDQNTGSQQPQLVVDLHDCTIPRHDLSPRSWRSHLRRTPAALLRVRNREQAQKDYRVAMDLNKSLNYAEGTVVVEEPRSGSCIASSEPRSRSQRRIAPKNNYPRTSTLEEFLQNVDDDDDGVAESSCQKTQETDVDNEKSSSEVGSSST
ncbi:unnamed protein product, partial [Amoebophrya sp. A25]